MSFNKLLYNHQIALMKAASAGLAPAQCACVNQHEILLHKARQQFGVAQYPIASIKASNPSTPYSSADQGASR